MICMGISITENNEHVRRNNESETYTMDHNSCMRNEVSKTESIPRVSFIR